MSPRRIASVALAAGLVFALPAPAAAQSPQVWAAFSPLHDNGRWLLGAAGGGWLKLPGLGGLLGDSLDTWLSVDAGIHPSSAGSYSIAAVLGGIAATVKTNSRVAPFVQFVVGLERCCGENALAFQPGGGVNYWLRPTLAIRAQIDFRIALYSGQTFNETRLVFGVVLPFGKR